MPNAAAARELEVAVKSVSKWRRRFAEQRLAGLEDDAPVGLPKADLVLSEDERARLTRWGPAGEDGASTWRCGRRSCWPAPRAS